MAGKPNYDCTQDQLYSITEMAAANYETHLADFSAFSASYDAAWKDGLIALLVAAENIPDQQTRYEAAEIARTVLVNCNEVILELWQGLKRYIERTASFEGIEEIKLESAGSLFFRKASNKNWEYTRHLANSACDFIDANEVALGANGNMPAKFKNDFTKARDEYLIRLQEFVNLEQASLSATDEKIAANNSVYDKLSEMLKDGQFIFRNDETLKNQFTFAKLLSYFSDGGVTGIRVSLKDVTSQLPIKGAIISMQPYDIKFETNEDGVGTFETEAGLYTMAIAADGYIGINLKDVEIRTSVMARKNLMLTKEAVPEPA